MSSDWRYAGLGMGNHLIIREDVKGGVKCYEQDKILVTEEKEDKKAFM